MLGILQGLQSPNVIAPLAADVHNMLLQSDYMKAVSSLLVPSLLDLLISWIRQLSTVEPEQVAQVCLCVHCCPF